MCLIWGVPARKKTSDTREDPMVWGKESLSFPIDLHVHSLDGKTISKCLSFYVSQTCTWCFFVITWIIRRQKMLQTNIKISRYLWKHPNLQGTFWSIQKESTAVKHVPPSNKSWRESLAKQQTGLSKKAQPKWLKVPTVGHGLRTAFQITSISS